MIIFSIFTLFVGASAFAFALIGLQFGIGWSLAYVVLAMLVVRGILSMARRALILRERIGPGPDVLQRKVETNRAIFWKRVLFVAAIPIVYFAVMEVAFEQGPTAALEMLPTNLTQIFTQVAYLVLLLGANFMLFFGPFYLYMRISKTVINPDAANFGVSIEDVRGQKSAVDEMKRILQGQPERGVLMVGPPGTGKTMLAKAIASSMDLPIYLANGGTLAEMFLGIDALSIYLMVRAARKQAKVFGGCIVFIDDIDALGAQRARQRGGMFGGGTLGLSMLLILMDGIDNPSWILRQLRSLVNLTLDGLFIPRGTGANDNKLSLRISPLKAPNYDILFLGATEGRAPLYAGVHRPGRFRRRVVFELPDAESRKNIAALYFDNKPHDPALDTPSKRDEFARITARYSPAEIEHVLSLAQGRALQRDRNAFTWGDLRAAVRLQAARRTSTTKAAVQTRPAMGVLALAVLVIVTLPAATVALPLTSMSAALLTSATNMAVVLAGRAAGGLYK